MIKSKTINAGPVGMKPKGDYSATATYTLLDCVKYAHDSWVCKALDADGNPVAVTGQAPADGSQYWMALTDGGRAAYAEGQAAKEHGTAAQTAAELANTKASLADTAATNANTKAALANEKATLADEKATLASTAAANADAKAALANTAATNADNSRQQIEANEQTRQSNETSRVNNESGRVSAETSRVSAETSRASAEQSRITAEQGRVSAESSRVSAESSRVSAETSRVSAETARETQASQDHNQYVTDHANAQGAENVDAQLQGYTVSITNRQGVTTSVDIGFEIYRTYVSVAAMNADAANVPQGKFVVIATTDSIDPDNAKMYCRNSQEATAEAPFTFLCDLDQASSSAWADWLNNMKPAIQQATTDATDAATNANTKAGVAQDAADNANAKATQANTAANNANTAATNANSKATLAGNEADRAKNMNDHPAYIGEDDYWYFWDYTNQRYVKGEYARGAAATIVVGSTTTLDADQPATVVNSGTEGAAVFNFGIPRGVKGADGEKGDKGDKGDDLDYSTMTEEEKSELNDTIVQHIVSENILGPTYDEADHGFDFPAAMHVQWDAVNHGFDI